MQVKQKVYELYKGTVERVTAPRTVSAMRDVVQGLRQATRHTEMDGVVVVGSPPRAEETPGAEDASAVSVAAEARKRRMLHLAAALGDVADAHARRRLMLMRAAATAAAVPM